MLDIGNRVIETNGTATRLRSRDDIASSSLEPYRALALTLARVEPIEAHRVVLITSALGGEGKTLTIANLGLTLSGSFGRKVLVVEGNLRRPMVHHVLPIQPFSGAGAVDTAASVAGAALGLTLYQVNANLFVYACLGGPPADPVGALMRPDMERLLTWAKGEFEWVLVDSPAALIPDAKILAQLADGVVFVVSTGATPFEAARRGLDNIGRGRILGIAMNRAPQSSTESALQQSQDDGGDIGSYLRFFRRSLGDDSPTPGERPAAGFSATGYADSRPPRGPRFGVSVAQPKTRWPASRALNTVAIAVLALVGIVGYNVVRRPLAPLAATAPSGAVTLTSDPAGATVTIDAVERGVTPLKVTVAPGQHVVEMAIGGSKRSLPLSVESGTVVAQHIEFAVSATQTGRLEVITEPPGARVVVDGIKVGTTPVHIPTMAVGDHKVTITRDRTSVQRSITIAAGSTATVVVPMPLSSSTVGWAQITSPIDLQVFEGGQLIGTSQSGRLTLPAGGHDFEVVNTAFEFRHKLQVQVESGQTSAVTVDVPTGSFSVNVLPWAEVTIDGRAVGMTPIGNLSLPIGDHEVVIRHPELGERVQTVAVRASTPVRLGFDLTK